MSETSFTHDVFLSHSSKDKPVVRELAARLKQDGIRVWLDEWEIRPGDSIPSKVEEGLDRSRVLVLCMSANAFGSDWAQLEAGTFRFRDPLNKERRFLPLRLDNAPIKGSLAQFLYIDWCQADREQEYAKLLGACRSLAARPLPWCDEGKTGSAERIHLGRLVGSARRQEWKRLRTDFEAEARSYHDAKISIFYVTKDGPTKRDQFPRPHHVINLWQHFGTNSQETKARLSATNLTDFGISGAEVSAFALVTGKQTDLFCRMATRSGSLLPDQVGSIITAEISKKFAKPLEPGKPIAVSNSNPLAKWVNLLLVATRTSHPERFTNGELYADPFAASLTVFDYFQPDTA